MIINYGWVFPFSLPLVLLFSLRSIFWVFGVPWFEGIEERSVVMGLTVVGWGLGALFWASGEYKFDTRTWRRVDK